MNATQPTPVTTPQSWECKCGLIEHRSDGRWPAGWMSRSLDGHDVIICPDCVVSETRRYYDNLIRTPDTRHARQLSNCMMTHSGRLVDLLDPQPGDILIDDIAVQLGRTARFAGATLFYYSVAEHSVHVSRLVPPEHALAALLHDAAEAYLGDVISPLKALLPEYRVIEARFERAIAEVFRVDLRAPEIKKADVDMAVLEARLLMKRNPAYWGTAAPIDGVELLCLPPANAASMFMLRFDQLITRHLNDHRCAA